MPSIIEAAKQQVSQASSFLDIAKVFQTLFKISIPGQEPPKTPDEYKNENSDYGLKVSGIKAREKLNEQAREIISRVDKPEDLTDEDRAILKQYSGRGGLTENSQFEYYTPQHVAEGCWYALKANGIISGNVCDPSTGHGTFSATKPAGVIITGCDIDATSSRVAQLLNPEDKIENKSFEKLAVETPDNFFDAVVTNVPFGDARGRSKFDDPAYQSETKLERYFIMRAIDKVKPGGLCVFVVPINIVGAKGKGWERWRLDVSKKAEFLGAHKMPSGTFKAQGTDTVTDVVVFKKHPEGLLDTIDSLSIETLRSANVAWDEFLKGMYWQGEGRKYIMGAYLPKVDGDRWSRETVDGDVDDAGLKAKLAAKFQSRIDWEALEVAAPIERNYAEGDRKIINGVECEFNGTSWVRVMDTKTLVDIDSAKYGAGSIEELKELLSTPQGCLALTADQAFAIFKAFPDLLTPLQRDSIQFAMSQAKEELAEQLWRGSIIGGMIGRYENSMSIGLTDDTERVVLQELVTAEINRFGHPKNNKKLTITGESARMFGMFANAVDQKGNFSDLLNGTLDKSGRMLEFDSSNPQAIVEHLFIREGITNIELDDLKKLYTGTMELNTLGDIAEVDGIAITADGMLMPMSRFTSGDIYPKLDALNQALGIEPDKRIRDKWVKQMQEIMQRRKITAPDSISFGFQNKWYSRKYIVDFLQESGYKGASYGVMQDVTEEDAYSGKVVTRRKFVEDYDNPFGEFSGLDTKGFDAQFLKFLNGGNVTSSDAERIDEYKRKVRDLEGQFNAWIKAHPDIDQIGEQFNRKFNGYTPFELEQTDLGLQGVNSTVKLHGYQNAAIRRLSEEGRGFLAFDVGLGKTYSALGLYVYNKQMGRSKRTCIVVPKSVLSNWYHEAGKFLGDMGNCFFVGLEVKKDRSGNPIREPLYEGDGTPKINATTGEQEYQEILQDSNDAQSVFDQMWSIPQSNYSLVVMTFEKFGSIPMKQENRDKYVDKMVAKSMVGEKGSGEFRKVSYADAKKSLKKEEQFASDGTAKKGELPFFEDLGFTDVITDEAHAFKNCAKGGDDTSGIAYISNPTVSKRGVDMSMKMAYLRDTQNGRGAYMLTATPLTNSPLEIFNMLSMVAPMEEFESRDIYNVDDFVRQFGDIQSVDKLMMTGELKSKDGLVGFKDLDGLRNLFFKYVNQKSAADFPDQLKLPEQVDVKLDLPLSSQQESLYDALKKEAKNAVDPNFKGDKRPVFSILRDMEKVATDLDLYHKTMTFVFQGGDKDKVKVLIGKLPASIKVKRVPTFGDAYYDDTLEEQKAVEMTIPLTYTEHASGDSYTVSFPDAYEQAVVGRLSEHGIDEDRVAHPLTPKYAKLIENCKKEFELDGKQLIFTEEKTQHEKIVRILVHHIPALKGGIAIINADEASGDKLQQIVDSYNNGVFKFVVCNKKAEVGVNLQKGTTAIHHLTFPWTPASIQQRNGRGVRQGNTASHVQVYYYQAGFDAYKLNLLNKKASWIGDIIHGDQTSAQNGNIVDSTDMQIMLSDNPEEAKRRIMEQQAAKAKQAKEYGDKQAMITFQKLANNVAALATLDTAKASKKAALETKIPELEGKIARYRDKGISLPEGDEERKRLGGLVLDAQASLDKAKSELKNLDTTFQTQKENMEAGIKRDRLALKARADKEGVPFDKTLLDNPENAVITPKGQVLALGDMYETTNVVKARSSYESGTFKAIVKVIEFTNDRKSLTFEILHGNLTKYRSESTYTVTDFFEKLSPVKCSYSEDEIRLKDFLTKDHIYSELVDGAISKEVFQSHYAEIKWRTYGYTFLLRDAEGNYEFSATITTGRTVVFPDKESETFKKAVCEAYLAEKRRGYGATAGKVMQLIFGSGYDQLAMEYGNNITHEQVVAKMGELYQGWLNGFSGETTAYVLRFMDSYSSAGLDAAFRSVAQMGDNTDEIKSWRYAFISAKKAEYQQKVKDEKEAEERAAEAERLQTAKNDPNYKEVPEQVRKAFEQIGITVKTNIGDVIIPGFKGRGGTPTAPFSKWFFQDRDGKNGKLYRVKDILKARYGAAFFQDAGGDFDGAWWHIPATTDLAKVYELMA